MNNQIYCDPNAYVHIPRPKPEKPKIDKNHIEKVIISEPYENFPNYYNKTNFCPSSPPQPPKNHNFDISKLLPLLTGKGNVGNLLPNLLSQFGLGDKFAPLISELTKPKKQIEHKIKNDDPDSISKYERVKR